MCDIAPFQMKCEYEYDLICCQAHHLYQALNNMYQLIPIVRNFVGEYHCPDFEPNVGELE